MKNSVIKLMLIVAISVSSLPLLAGGPPPPPGDHGGTGNANAGSAPIGGGLFILLGLGAAYGGRKLYVMNQEEMEE